MTAEAQKFITPLTFEALSGRKVRTGTFDLVDTSDPQHIGLTERADLMLVAPATNNVIAKVAHGLCDDLVSLMVCAAACPVVFAPAMNNRMWDHPVAQENVAKLDVPRLPLHRPRIGLARLPQRRRRPAEGAAGRSSTRWSGCSPTPPRCRRR